ncbi:hypothetical protein [Modestobacter sp. SYSU DS0290]
MLHRSRTLAVGGLLLALLPTAACSADGAGTTDADAASTGSAAAGVSETPALPTGAFSSAEPTEVVTDPPATPTDPAAGEADVFVTASYWDAAERTVTVRSEVPGVVEEGGTCTLTLTRDDGTSATATREGVANVSTTSCGALSIAGDQLAPGAWTAVVGYRSGTTQGSSEPVQVDVP